jgi:hypothetical protein
VSRLRLCGGQDNGQLLLGTFSMNGRYEALVAVSVSGDGRRALGTGVRQWGMLSQVPRSNARTVESGRRGRHMSPIEVSALGSLVLIEPSRARHQHDGRDACSGWSSEQEQIGKGQSNNRLQAAVGGLGGGWPARRAFAHRA